MKRPAVFGVSLLACLAGLSSSASATDEILWPTDAGHCVTSSFCEFRPGHFHSGLDVSTGGKTGFRCFAVADGFVARARLSCGGYGRALYVRMNDGRTALYAHLSAFGGALADSVWAWQESSGSAYFDRSFEPGEFPVHRGDVVAFTGQSGVGVPHLHFEIRDEAERPVDPMTAGLTVPDAKPPFITRIALTALSPASSIDGSSDTVVLDVHPVEGQVARGRIPRVIPVEGEIGFAVEVDESTDACRYRLAPRRLELWDGDERLYAVDYAGFSFDETDRIDFQIDPRFSYAKTGRFHNLFRRVGNTLPFVVEEGRSGGVIRGAQLPPEERRLVRAADDADSPPPTSVQRLGEKVRRLRIVAIDAAGNAGEAEIELSFAPPPTIPVLAASWMDGHQDDATFEGSWADSIEVIGAVRAEGREVRDVQIEYSLDTGATWTAVGAVLTSPDGSFRTRIVLPPRVPGSGRRDPWVRARAVDMLGASSLPRTVALDESVPVDLPAPPFEIVTLGGWIEMRFDESVTWDVLDGGWSPRGDEVQAVLVRPWKRGVRVVAQPGPATLEVFESIAEAWKGYDPWGRRRLVRARLPELIGEAGATLEAENGARVRFLPAAFEEPAYAVLRSSPAQDMPELRALGPWYVVDTGSLPVGRDYEVTLRALGDVASEHAAVFVREPEQPRYVDTELRAGGTWVARTRTPLAFGLFEDHVPPRVGPPRFEKNGDRWTLLFAAKDEGAGIACDEVEVFLDGIPLVHELDDETGDVVAYPVNLVSNTETAFEARVVDRCGNSSVRQARVRVP